MLRSLVKSKPLKALGCPPDCPLICPPGQPGTRAHTSSGELCAAISLASGAPQIVC